MKKFFYQFFVVILAIASFTFVSCSDDDDNSTPSKNPIENESSYYCNLTFDGENLFGNKSIFIDGGPLEIPSTDGNEYIAIAIYAQNWEFCPYFDITIPADKGLGYFLKSGIDLCEEEAWKMSAPYENEKLTHIVGNIYFPNGDSFTYYAIKSGNLIVNDYKEGEYIELEFKNCELYDYIHSSHKSIIVNGKLKAPLDDKQHKI